MVKMNLSKGSFFSVLTVAALRLSDDRVSNGVAAGAHSLAVSRLSLSNKMEAQLQIRFITR